MKVSYVITVTATELRALERVIKEVKGVGTPLKQGEFKISQKSKLSSALLKFKLKRTARLEVSCVLSEEYALWVADTVERLAPLVRGLIPQLANLGEETVKCGKNIPTDTAVVTESHGI